VTLLGRFLKDSIADIDIGAYAGSVEVAASKDVILGVVFRGGVLVEVWVEAVTSAVSAGLLSMGVSSSAIKSSK
jgi:hypothetical protein